MIAHVAGALPRRGQTRAAVAYVTMDHLGLGLGDEIAVNASINAVRSGATNPKLLLQLLQRDVVVVNHPQLHAKVIVKGPVVAVGSANLSQRSAELQELMWVTRDPVLLRRTAAWLDELLAPAPMTADAVRKLVPLYRTDVKSRGRRAGKDGHEPAGAPLPPADPFAPATVSRVLIWKQDPRPNEYDLPEAERDGTAVNSPLTAKQWVGNSQRGDRIGDVWLRWQRGRLDAPRRVLKAKSKSRAPDKSWWTLLGYRPDDKSIAVPDWVRAEFQDDLAADGAVLVTDKGIIARLLGLYSD